MTQLGSIVLSGKIVPVWNMFCSNLHIAWRELENRLLINQPGNKGHRLRLSVALHIGKQIDYKYNSLGLPTEVDEKMEGE